MRTLATLAATALLALPAVSPAADRIIEVDQPEGIPSFLGYKENEVIVVMKPTVGKLHVSRSTDDVAHIGEKSFDAISDRFAVSGVRPQFLGAADSKRVGAAELAKYHKVRFESGQLDEVIAAYENHPMVERVEPIGIHTLRATPNDNFYSPYQWYLNQANDDDVDAPEAWDIQTGSSSVTVAVLDSGTRYYHPDLGGVNAGVGNPSGSRGNMWINQAELNGSNGVDDDNNGYTDDWIGYDFVASTSNCWPGEDCSGADNDPRDFNGHGTHCAGIVGMLTNDGYGMAGIAGGWGNGSQAATGNGAKVMALRIGHSYNYFGQEVGIVQMDAAAEAFYYAADNGARIASCSWGSSNSGGLGAAVNYFLNAGGLVFVAAGNDGNQSAAYLNSRNDCISVAATDESDNAASFTNYGSWIDISAPGNAIYATYHDHTDPNTDYWAALSGTSMACPLTAGVAALVWSQNPGWTAAQVENQLYTTADNIDAELSGQYVGLMGAGRVNAAAAVNTGGPAAPVANFSGAPTSGTDPLNVSFSDSSTGSITSWAWTFGDGGSSSAQNPSHTYTSAGNYTVSLTVTGPGGSDGETKTNYITVTDPGGGSWVTITYDDFEGGLGNYTDGGNDMYLYTSGTFAHQGSNAAGIQDNSGVASSFFHSSGHNVTGYSDLEVEFWYRAESMDNTNEDFWVQYYDGSSWQTVATFARNTDFQNGIFYNETVSIPAGTYNYPANAQLRFLCDASGNQDDVYIDEIEFRGFSGGGGPTVPASPSGLVAAATGTSTIDVTWNDNANDEDSYSVERSINGSSYSVIATLGANAESYGDSGLSESTEYFYRVRASNTAGNSAYSNVDSATTQSSGGGSWVTITYDDFEGGLGNYSDGGNDMSRYTGGTFAHQGNAAADIQDNSGVASSFFHSSGHNVSGYSDLEVEFWYYPRSMEGSEDFFVEYYDGSSWQIVAQFVNGQDFTNGTFENPTVSIPSGSFNYPTNAQLRFRCDASGNGDDIYIDQIEFRGFSSGTQGGQDFLASRGGIVVAPSEFSLSQNRPNPFRASGATLIEFALPTSGDVNVSVYNVLGQRVETLANGPFQAGTHSIRWAPRRVAAGTYYYRIEANGKTQTKRLMLLK